MVSLGWLMWGHSHFLLALEKDSQEVAPIIMALIPWKDELLKVWKWKRCRSTVSDSLWPRGLQPSRLLYGILQARILEWVAMPFSSGSSWPRDRSWVSFTTGRFFTIWAAREAELHPCLLPVCSAKGEKQGPCFLQPQPEAPLQKSHSDSSKAKTEDRLHLTPPSVCWFAVK